MAKRLVILAKELNVGVGTIVDFLKENGHEIDNKPTAKLTDEMEALLLREYSSSKTIKEQADLLIKTPTKKEPKPLFKLPKATPPPPPPPVSSPPPPPPVVKKEEEVVEEVIEAKEEVEENDNKKGGLKVVGKINLNEVGKKPKKKEKKKEEENIKEEVKETVKEEVVDKVIEEKIEKIEEKEELTPKEESTPKIINKEDKEEVKGEGVEDDPNYKSKVPQLEGLKIKGKINVDKFKKPSKKERLKKKKEKEKAKKEEANKEKQNNKNKGNNQKPDEDQPKKRRRKRKKVIANKIEGEKRSDSGTKRRRKKKDEVVEISQKEIEERIKETKARLQGGKNTRQKVRRESRLKKKEDRERIEEENRDERLQLTEFISVSELASLMDTPPTQVIMTCMNLGYFVTLNQRLDAEIIEIVASEFGHEVVFVDAEEALEEEEEIIDDPEDLLPRAPIVTVMGHVDHGKTSLLDYVREANVAEGEAGGITQHIGAYEVKVDVDGELKKVTFLDTPGHEAFTAMRARGAKVTDVAVIIISADDKVMPQTKEAISHAQAAGVPMIFAINKIDKPGADPERIKAELANMNLQVDSWGGSYSSQEISAKQGTNVDLLLEKIILEAEVLELKANPDRKASGVILEASLDKGRGYVSKILVQTGTLKVGDPVVSGEHSGKIKAMFNERGKRIKEAGPSTPVLVLGLSGAPQAGEKFKAVDSEPEARNLANKRSIIAREQSNRANKRISLEEIGRRLALDSFKELNLIVKGDVDGSVEALSDSLLKQSHETVQVNIIHKAVGQIIESDILLASASDAIVVGFQVRPSAGARKLAEKEGVQIKTYSIIYQAIDEIRSAIEGMLEPTKEEKIVAEVQVREIYKINRVGTIAGCFVNDGLISRNTKIRIIRDGIVIYPTKEGQSAELGSLKRFKDDVKEVKKGLECGLTVKNYNDIKEGDIIEGYEIVEIKQTLD